FRSADDRVIITGKRGIQRQRCSAIKLTLTPHSATDAGGTVAGDHLSESFQGTSSRIESRKPGDQFEQKLLAQVIEILHGQPEPLAGPTRNAVGDKLEGGKISGGDWAAHRQDLDSSFVMNRRSPITTGEASLEPSRKLPDACRPDQKD